MAKKKLHFPFRFIIDVLPLVLVIFALKSIDSQENDAQVMNDLKRGLVFRNILWPDSDYCNWQGVTCSSDKRVIRIQIKNSKQMITGEFPNSFNNLTALQYLEFRGTHIGGPLPTFKGLSSLEVILLSENNFTSIPDDFFEGLSSLLSVTLDSLPLAAWQIPASLQTCSALVNFSANSANVNGMIPEFFNNDNFPSLMGLHLASNNLGGGLPSNFSKLGSLQSLWLNGQNLGGTIDVIQNMTDLKQVWLNMNSFTGSLPEFTGLQSLSDLNIRDNKFTGLVPQSLQTLKSLRVVRLTNNLLQGPLPEFDKAVNADMLTGINSFCLDSPGPCSDNVNTLLLIAKNVGYPRKFAEQWKGNDPCWWLGITCLNGKISVINFQRTGLTGTISPNFSSILSLQTLNLANNNLYGTIPTEITKLPELRLVDVSNNHLSGKVPVLRNGIIKTEGNPDIGEEAAFHPSGTTPSTDPSHQPPRENPGGGGGHKSPVSVGVIVGAVIGVVCVILLVVLLLVGFCLYKKKHETPGVANRVVVHPHHSGSDPETVKITVAGSNANVGAASQTYSHISTRSSDIHMVEDGKMVISIQVLRNVTNNFSEENILGHGGFGTVYKGELHDGTEIAVKRMDSGVMSEKGLTEFKSEIDVLNKVRHRHLVSLIGYCLDGNERILVYEYMPQGTLSQHLFNWEIGGLKPLEWTRRLIIALDVARAVEYLHRLANQSFIHRDLKPSNILLGDNMRAKVADFGLVRLAPEGKTSIETRLAGTFGYLAPEYAATGRVTTKVDVYAFGVILMELITGRRALDESEPEESMHLVTWFRRMSINKDTSVRAIDPTLEMDDAALASINTISELAGYCCSSEPHQRPEMGHVVNVLSSLVELWKPSSGDIYSNAIDMDLSLVQTLRKWQAVDGRSTESSIPTRPSGFADTFTPTDAR